MTDKEELERLLEPYNPKRSLRNVVEDMVHHRLYVSALEICEMVRETCPEIYNDFHDQIQKLMHSTSWQEPARPIEEVQGYEEPKD